MYGKPVTFLFRLFPVADGNRLLLESKIESVKGSGYEWYMSSVRAFSWKGSQVKSETKNNASKEISLWCVFPSWWTYNVISGDMKSSIFTTLTQRVQWDFSIGILSGFLLPLRPKQAALITAYYLVNTVSICLHTKSTSGLRCDIIRTVQ